MRLSINLSIYLSIYLYIYIFLSVYLSPIDISISIYHSAQVPFSLKRHKINKHKEEMKTILNGGSGGMLNM